MVRSQKIDELGGGGGKCRGVLTGSGDEHYVADAGDPHGGGTIGSSSSGLLDLHGCGDPTARKHLVEWVSVGSRRRCAPNWTASRAAVCYRPGCHETSWRSNLMAELAKRRPGNGGRFSAWSPPHKS